MDHQSSEKTIVDQVGLSVSISRCTTRVNRDLVTAFGIVGTPHMLRFRRVYKNIMEFNGYYDIYIDSDLKLLLYENDRPGTVTVTDSTGTPVSIPVYMFTGMEPYALPQRQPAPFCYVSPEDIQKAEEVNDILNGAEKNVKIGFDNVEFADETSTENSKSENAEGDGLVTIKGTDIPDDSAADDYANPEPIPDVNNAAAATLDMESYLKKAIEDQNKIMAEINKKLSSELHNLKKENEEKKADVTVQPSPQTHSDTAELSAEQLISAEEISFDPNGGMYDPLAEVEDIDSEQIDIAEETLSEEDEILGAEDPAEKANDDKIDVNNTFKYYASQLINKPKPPQNQANLTIDSGASISVSEDEIHREYKQTEPSEPGKDDGKSATPNNSSAGEENAGGDSKRSESQAEDNAEEPAPDNSSSDMENNSNKNDNNDNHETPKGRINYMDVVASGAEVELSGKMGIDNKRLCRIKRVIPSRKPQDVEKAEPYSIYMPIANFCLVPLTIERHCYADNISNAFVHIAVFSPEFPFRYQMLFLDTEDIEKVAKIVRKKYPQLYYDPDLNSAPRYVSTALSIMMSGMPEKNIMHFYGWSNFNGRMVYMNDNISENPLFKSESGKSLLFNQNMYQGDALLYAFRMLKLSKDINKTLPLFLTAHLGVMYYFFELAGYAPRFVLFLRGETGSLKTSISKVFFRFLADGNNEIPANFNDTMTALEIKMGQTRDEVFLVDDFRPSSMNSELVRMQANLEKLIRFYGDGIGKGRGNISLKLRKEFKPHSMCAVTGEYIHGTASSLQRLLIISVDKNTYDRELLKFYQDNPWVFSTHMNFFITYLSQNAQEIIKYISSKFVEKRAFYTSYLASKRLVDTAVCMELTAEIILLFYANRCKLVHPMDAPVQLEIWQKSILNFVRESDILANHREPVDMFCAAIAEIAHSAVTKIPPSKVLFEQNIKYALGYYDYDARVLYLKPEESYTEVVQYWTKQGVPFTIKERPLRKMLLMSGLLIGSTDGDSTKTSTPVFINGKTTRMLGFNLTKLGEKYKVFASPPSPLIFR